MNESLIDLERIQEIIVRPKTDDEILMDWDVRNWSVGCFEKF